MPHDMFLLNHGACMRN